jgi:chaperonin GroEL
MLPHLPEKKLTTECLLIDIKEENDGGNPMSGGMPGMI